jgi:hypothetical protein
MIAVFERKHTLLCKRAVYSPGDSVLNGMSKQYKLTDKRHVFVGSITVVQTLVRMQNDIKELTRQTNHVITVLQSLKPDNQDIDLHQLPDGINIPMISDVDDMEAMEAALADKQLRKNLVCYSQMYYSVRLLCMC